MEVVTVIAAWALCSIGQNLPVSNSIKARLEPICGPSFDVGALAGRLSEGAEIYLPGSSEFTAATARWSSYEQPTFKAVVVPSVENDVAVTVQFANAKHIPYLPVNRGHGAIITTGRMTSGIQIWMDKLNTVEISNDGHTAVIGGGTYSGALINTLWAAGKQTVTGACECTSLLGPGLGGGHGFLQGRHGLIADQFVSMNIVMADGQLRTIDGDYDADLWWAMRGAGHNFGIVTSVTSKVYDVQRPNWAYQSFIFTGDKVEALYEAINTHFGGTQSVDVINYSFFINIPDIDPTAPVIMFFILQEDVSVVDAAYTAPFEEIGAVTTEAAGGEYLDLTVWTQNSLDSALCQRTGLSNMRFPIDTDIYNTGAQRKAFDHFAAVTQDTPALNGSLLLFEGYTVQGVQAVPRESTAYAYRDDNLLFAPLIIYQPDGADLDESAVKFGQDLRQILYEGSGRTELHTYVNYAFGTESLENMYGYESWRQAKLKALKDKYDPSRKFSFYAPIA